VTLHWTDGKAISAKLATTLDGVQRLRAPKSQQIASIRNGNRNLTCPTETDGSVSFQARRGNSYEVLFSSSQFRRPVCAISLVIIALVGSRKAMLLS
jgi:hypothetical protein